MSVIYEHRNKLWIVALIVAVILGVVLWNDSVILPFTYDKNRPAESSDSVNADLVLAYKEASREAVEDYFGKEVTDDYIYCFAQAIDAGFFYCCNVDGIWYRFTIYAGSAMDTYSYLLYNTKAPDPGMDNFDFELQDGWFGGVLFASIQDA